MNSILTKHMQALWELFGAYASQNGIVGKIDCVVVLHVPEVQGIEQQRQNRSRVLVHCHSGDSEAAGQAAVVTAKELFTMAAQRKTGG